MYVREVNDDEKPQEKTITVVEPENGAEGKELVALEACNNKEGESETPEGGSNGRENGLPDDRSSDEESSASAPVPASEATDGYEEKSVIVASKGDEDESEESDRDGEEEDDEFAAMSDEELNRRVEEFIWKLKRQIRLQGVRGLG